MNLKTMRGLVPFLLVLACTACGPALVTSEPVTSVPPVGTPGEGPVMTPPPGATALPDSDAPLAALVNGQPIYLADYERALGQYEADLPLRGIDPASAEGQADLARARSWILDFMITEELIVQAAEKASVAVTDAEVDAVMTEMIAENGGEEAFQAKLAEWGETYEIHREKERKGLIVMQMSQRVADSVPTVAEHVHARHILVDTQEEAERLYDQLEGGADFAVLARTYSQDPNTREAEGDLGWFPRGILTVPKVEEVAFSLSPGQYSEVVPSLLGYHIVQVVERDPAREVSPDNLHLLQERVLQEWVEGLRTQADIQIFVDTAP
ncbi:MAG: peptidylprolyl isomerase [Anaerolineae bacterium]|nr:peptidylprolyl isomerase [Anaerolineae bacterium]